MAFFDPPPPPPPPPPSPFSGQPEWMGPPEGWLGGFVPTRVVLARTSRQLVTLGPMTAFPTGVQLSVIQTSREPIDHQRRGPIGSDHNAGALRIGVANADGGKWQSPSPRPMPDDGTPAGPLLWFSGGGGGGHSLRSDAWLWPLPPSGPVTFAFAWPDEGIAETTVEVDGELFRSAASEAVQLWEPLSAEEHRAIDERWRAGPRRPPPGTGFVSGILGVLGPPPPPPPPPGPPQRDD